MTDTTTYEISQDELDTFIDTVKTIRENRPDDPETVSYALDDLCYQLKEIQSR